MWEWLIGTMISAGLTALVVWAFRDRDGKADGGTWYERPSRHYNPDED